jgi:hypothetical protein
MPKTAIWAGRLLVLVGVVGYAYGLYVNAASLTALIPAIVGIILMALGYVASSSDNLRKHLMHAAVIVGLLGFLAALGGLFRKGMPTSIGAGTLSQIAMALICLAFVVLAVRSFIAARRTREEAI